MGTSGQLVVVVGLGLVSLLGCFRTTAASGNITSVHPYPRNLLAGTDAICRAKYVHPTQQTFPTSCLPNYEEAEDGNPDTRYCYSMCSVGYEVNVKNETQCIQKCPSGYTAKGTKCEPKVICKTGKLEKNFNKCCPPCANGYTAYNGTCASNCPKDYKVKNMKTCYRVRGKISKPRTLKSRNCYTPNNATTRRIAQRSKTSKRCPAGRTLSNGDCVDNCDDGYDVNYNSNTPGYECTMKPDNACNDGMKYCSNYCIGTELGDSVLNSGDACKDLELVLDTVAELLSAGGKNCIPNCSLDTRKRLY